MLHSAIYTGHVMHHRRGEVAHRFRHRLYVAAIDLDELPALDRALRLFSHQRANLFGLRDRDYAGGAAAGSVRAAVDAFLAEHAPTRPPPARVELLTQLRVFDYVFNPVSFFLCWSGAGTLDAVIGEVNNNWGGNHRYLLDERNRVADPVLAGGAGAHFRTAKRFFVSPLIHDASRYDWHIDVAGPSAPELAVRVDVYRPRPDGSGDERFLVTHFGGVRRRLDDRTLARLLISYPFQTLQIIALIHGHALRLRARGAPYRTPGPDHRP